MSEYLDVYSSAGRKGRCRLYYGDNLQVMRDVLQPSSVDLIYLDPPFNSQRTYNLMYRRINGVPVPEQLQAFTDTWTLDEEKRRVAAAMPLIMREEGVDEYYIEFWKVWINALKNTQPSLLAYLTFMVQRIIYMRSILTHTGSIYLHCDSNASHYLKVLMDGIFGHQNFRNEIIWKRTFSNNSAKRWGEVHDTILFYTKSDRYTWNKVEQKLDSSYVDAKYKHSDERGVFRYMVLTAPGLVTGGPSGRPWQGYDPSERGRHWAIPRQVIDVLRSEGVFLPDDIQGQLDCLFSLGLIRFGRAKDGSIGAPEIKRYLASGQPLQDVVTDISPLNSQAAERLGYPTQKPVDLLSRIILASSNPGDTIFDPFCGCGTTIYAAASHGRRWIGCDIAILPINIVQDALKERFDLEPGRDFDVSGMPASVEQADDLYARNPKQFEQWFLEAVGGYPLATDDGYADGRMFFPQNGKQGQLILDVKYNPKPGDVRRLIERIESAKLDGGVILSVRTPSRLTLAEAEMAGRLPSDPNLPMIQFLSVEEFLEQKQGVRLPVGGGAIVAQTQGTLGI